MQPDLETQTGMKFVQSATKTKSMLETLLVLRKVMTKIREPLEVTGSLNEKTTSRRLEKDVHRIINFLLTSTFLNEIFV